jgi:hypothetical protein
LSLIWMTNAAMDGRNPGEHQPWSPVRIRTGACALHAACVRFRRSSSSEVSPASGGSDTEESAVSTSRLQLALNVTDIDEATRY